MCGIAGIYNFKTNAQVTSELVRRMIQTMVHRGPDAEGVYSKGALGLGHRRLSILDLNVRSQQPMSTSDGRFTIVFNGEIYNYIELRKTLQNQRYQFKTDSDTEVLLVLFSREGPHCLHKLNGMFAFAIWDERHRSLFLARDRLGIKPLYYVETADGMVFASEIKSLLVSDQIEAQVCQPSIDTFMTFGYVPGEKTLFHGIGKLSPGHSLQVSSHGIQRHQYWDVCYQPNNTRSIAETSEELRALLLDSVRIHLRSDVPVGVFLSGGLDSSAMVALLSEAGIEGIKTFSVGYDEGPAYDETSYAKIVAAHFNTDHHALYVNPNQFVEFIPKFVWYMDEPVVESPAISLYFVAKLLKQHVTVALSGEGSDELFGGYDIYRYMQWIEHFRMIPESLRSKIVLPFFGKFGNQKINKYLRLSNVPLNQRYLGVSLHDVSYKDRLYSSRFCDLLSKSDFTLNSNLNFFAKVSDKDALTQMLYSDMKAWLVDDLLIKADKMTMANSVELRVPFLDYRVVEYAATIPSKQKIHNGQVKWILKQALANHLPDAILRRKKVGFPTPLRLMFQRDLSEYLSDLLLSPRCLQRGYFRPAAVKNLLKEHAAGTNDHHQILWQLVILEEWHKQFIDISVRPPACQNPDFVVP